MADSLVAGEVATSAVAASAPTPPTATPGAIIAPKITAIMVPIEATMVTTPPPPRGRDWQPRSERGRSGSDSWDRTDDRPYDDRYDDRYRGEQDYQHLDRYNDNTDYSRHPSDGFSDDGFRSPARRHTSYRIPPKSAQSSPVTTSNKYSILDLDEQVRQVGSCEAC